MQDSPSFWTDIKALEERLSNAPDSFCFAGLSSVYLKAGLIDDALHVAREGVAKHPRYLAGQRALSLACHAKGLNEEALTTLKQIVVAVPEDVPSQKLLGRLLLEAGEQDSAIQVYRIALEFAPEDVECRLQLESLEKSAGVAGSSFMNDDGSEDDDEEIIEDLEILDEFDEEYSEAKPLSSEAAHDPLTTVTLAELYVTQGYLAKALEIYRAILNDNPTDRSIKERITELEAIGAGLTDSVAKCDDDFEDETDDVTEFSTPADELFQATSPIAAVPLHGVADNARATLDGWLENIRRIKSCR
ncbi:MAG: tetratricopeptide repeat protein [Desulfuromonadaceae bacterium]